jgi:predicted ATPase/class 3 adenylate cyclase
MGYWACARVTDRADRGRRCMTQGRVPTETLATDAATEGKRTTSGRMLAFMFTDVEGSTRTWERSPAEMRTALTRHDAILRSAVEGAGGRIVKTMGDGVMAVFGSAHDGVVASLDAQRAILGEPWPDAAPIRVRMGLHVGEASGNGDDFHGPAVNRTARIMAAGHGGQVLLSSTTTALVLDRLPAGASLRDLGEHQLKDLARPERVYQLVHPDLPAVFEPLVTVDERRGSLPAEPSAFVGREEERFAMTARLTDPHVRLVTLIGPGGIGKTRLAIRVARDLDGRFASGAAFVDLSEARDTSSVVTAIARDLGYGDVGERSQVEELAERIGTQQLLVVLDNFEQVTVSAPALSLLLRECPELKLLVTSREALHVQGEHIFPVDPMSLPDAGEAVTSAGQVTPFEAVRLFVERARAVRPDFRVTDENAAVVAEICRRLEGLPLAIELATARLRVFSLDALRDRLGSRLRGLGSGARDLPQRQQTLRATIDWSYQLLSADEQRLFDLLGACWGADVEAVEGVAAEAGTLPSGADPIDVLASLVDKSLIRRTERDNAEPRFEMLESVREFAAERLDERRDDADRVRAAHAAYFAAWAAVRGGDDPRTDRSTAISALGVDLENLRAAWRWSVDRRDIGCLEALLGGMRAVYDAHGWYRAISDLASDVLGVLETIEPTPDHALLAMSMRSEQARALTALEGYTPEVEAAYERLLGSVSSADVPEAYPILRGLASFHSFRNEYDKAAELGKRILRLGEERSDPAVQVDGHLLVGLSVSFGRLLVDGIPHLEAGLAVAARHPYGQQPFRLGPDARVAIHTALSLVRWWEGRLDTSLDQSRRAVSVAEALGHPSSIGYARFHAALLRLWRNEPETARELAVRVVDVADAHDLRMWKAVGTVVLGAAAIELGIGDEGLGWVEEGIMRYRGLRTPPIFWPFLLQIRSAACARAGRLTEGLASVDEALALAPMPDLLIVKGGLHHAAGADADAAVAFEQAIATARGWGALMPELRAALGTCELDLPKGPSLEVRRARLGDVLSRFTEGLDTPELTAARAVAKGGVAPGA